MDWLKYFEKWPMLAAEYGLKIVAAVAIFFIGKWIAKRVINIAGTLMRQREIDPTVAGFVTNILYMILLLLITIAALTQLGIPTAQFVAVIAAAGLAIGLALQGSLSNFASGVLLVSFRPCKVGDYIEAGGVAGTVDRITVFSTTLITPDQRTITVPNSNIMGGAIVNYSTSTSRRLDMVIGVAYKSDIQQVKQILRVNLAVRPWVGSADYWPLHFDLHEKIKQRFDEEGIEIPFPQMDISLEKVST
jgi:small conductance mechanosensitive channel